MKAKIQNHEKTGYNDLFSLDLKIVIPKKELLEIFSKSRGNMLNIEVLEWN